MKTDKVLINSLGCPKNLVDSEILANTLQQGGYTLVTDIESADTVVINTCAFIQPATQEAIDAILHAAEYKKNGMLKKIIVAGCLVERYKEDVIMSMPEVDACVGIDGYNDILEILQNRQRPVICGPKTDISFMNKSRLLSGLGISAYVKISEGCDNSCTYCTIPKIRGPFRSRHIVDIVNEVNDLCESKGIREITLVAQDTTAYGIDIYEKPSLVELLRELEKIEKLVYIRLLYCYPELIDDDLVNKIKTSEKIHRYLDIPLQHSSDRILKLMGRKGARNIYTGLIEKLRREIPDIVIRTTFIVGFPTETEQDFEDLCEFLEQNRFDRAGFFEYFKEEGSAAYNIKGHLAKKIKVQRRKIAENIQQRIMMQKNEQRIGKSYDMIVEDITDDKLFYCARSYAEAEEIDPVIYIAAHDNVKINDIITAKIVGLDGINLIAEVTE